MRSVLIFPLLENPDCYCKVVTKTIIQNIQIPQTFEYSGDPKNGNLKTGIIQKCFVLQNLTTYKPPLFWPLENPIGSVFRSCCSELFEVGYLNGLRLYCFCHLNTAGPIFQHHSNFEWHLNTKPFGMSGIQIERSFLGTF